MRGIAFAALLLALGAPAAAHDTEVSADRIRADMEFLAGEELQGRGSGTRDEAIAAAYVASQFRAAGLVPAPGMDSYLQKVGFTVPKLAGKPALKVGEKAFASLLLLRGSGDIGGKVSVRETVDAETMPEAEVLVLTGEVPGLARMLTAAAEKGIRLILVPETAATWRSYSQGGNQPRIARRVDGVDPVLSASLATLSAQDIEALAKLAGEEAALSVPLDLSDHRFTTNAIGYLPGRDPEAGLIMFGAHLDHLGVVDGVTHPGANDDASGTAAVLELARTLGQGKRLRRGLLFLASGAEELGLLGAQRFVAHPPVPLDRIAAQLQFEMIGAPDPSLPAGTMMMTGFERSDFGERLKAAGALVTADPYKEQNFFARSDNYALALRGVVAHTVSGWAMVPTYHQPEDTLAGIDFAFMTRAIASLVEPLRRIADSRTAPEWKPGGRP